MSGGSEDATAPAAGARVAVFRGLRGLGDQLVAVPALRTLREGMPEARLALIAPEETRTLAERFSHLLDEFVPFPGWPGLPEAAPPSADGALEGWRGADAVVQMHGDAAASNEFCASLGPRSIVSYGPAIAERGCRVHAVASPRPLREVDRCMELGRRAAAVLGCDPPPPDRSLEFPVSEPDRREAAGIVARNTGSEIRYFVLHPGAHEESRRWPAECFGAVGRVLARRGAVLVTGTAAEEALAAEVAGLIGECGRCVAGESTLGGVAALLAGASGLVTNDTGISHLADATRTRSVVVFVASDPRRWAPLDRTLHEPVAVPAPSGEGGRLTPEGLRLGMPSVPDVLAAMARLGMTCEVS